MRWFWIAAVGFLLLVFDVGAVSHLRDAWTGPDLMLLFAIYLALYGPIEDAPLSGWMLGFAKDLLSTGTLGLYAVLFLTVSFFLSRVRTDIFTETIRARAINGGIGTLVVYLAAAGWRWTQGYAFADMLPEVFLTAAWNAALAPVVFHLFSKWWRRLKVPRRPA